MSAVLMPLVAQALPLADFVKPKIEYNELAPLLVVFGAACVGVVAEAFLPRAYRHLVQVALAIVALLAAGVLTGILMHDKKSLVAAQGAISVDGPALFTWIILLALTLISVLLFAERSIDGGLSAFAGQAAAVPGSEAEREGTAAKVEHSEIFPLTLFAVGGMMLFASANDLLVLFVALEVFSLPLYLLCGLARRRRLISQEAAMKYFLLGAFASAFLLYGIALLYGYAGTMSLPGIADALATKTGGDAILLAGTGLIGVGLLFKVGAVPFHSWTPDVYQGAPTPITGFMAACTKIAAFIGLMRVFYVALGGTRWDWAPMMWVVAILTMVVGSIVAITQTDVKRMLAYSSIAHAGFLLTAFVGLAQSGSGVTSGITSTQAVLFYLVCYGFPTIGAFALVTLVRDAGGEATHLSRWAGLGKKSPLLAGIFAFFLLGFAGIPLTAGFTGKWAVFTAAWTGGAWPLVVVAVLCSLVAAFFYVRVIVLMFFSDLPADSPDVALPGWQTTTAVALGLAATVVLGLVPGPVLDLASRAGEFIR
ncbi:NADH dehydrogenase subunit N [Kribbella voronezhensis]|uniref:NADH-quinone oxidoreductase subunit N n=2 Tax=Kribbellaceae TaxID=2726069 RepID=A0A4R7TEW9_9ACTN|nr:NADH dehydrogenase subunit N [Kribbella voronezhensis]